MKIDVLPDLFDVKDVLWKQEKILSDTARGMLGHEACRRVIHAIALLADVTAYVAKAIDLIANEDTLQTK